MDYMPVEIPCMVEVVPLGGGISFSPLVPQIHTTLSTSAMVCITPVNNFDSVQVVVNLIQIHPCIYYRMTLGLLSPGSTHLIPSMI